MLQILFCGAVAIAVAGLGGVINDTFKSLF